jgi:hypothetical protein
MARQPHSTSWPVVEGFTDHRSFRPGESVGVRCSGRGETFAVEVRRVGATDDIVWTTDGVPVDEQPVPADSYRVGCDWPVTLEIRTEEDWRPGFYLVTLRGSVEGLDDRRRSESHAYFVLRSAESEPTRPLLVLSTNTWNAYNEWGGRCLYSGATEVSFRRPMERGYFSRAADRDGFDGRLASIDDEDPEHTRLQDYQRDHRLPLWTDSSGWFNWERRFVRFAEEAGVELDYALDIDLHGDPTLLEGRRLVTFVGHSEYWTWEMRDTLDAFVASGGNLAVFSGNTCFWQVRIDDDSHVMTCFKGTARFRDPVAQGADRSRLTSMWSDPWIQRPENHTIGLSFTRGGYHRVGQAVPRGAGAYTIHRPDHWALEGTGLCFGDQLGAAAQVVSYEVDGCAIALENGRAIPTGEDGTPTDLEIIGLAPARLISITDDRCEAPRALWADTSPPGDLEGVATVLFGDAMAANADRLAHGNCVMAMFTNGGTVFNAGSTDWAYGLDDDPIVQRITMNVLNRLTAG